MSRRWCLVLAVLLAACRPEPAPSPTAATQPSMSVTSTTITTTTLSEPPTVPESAEGTLRVGSLVRLTTFDPAQAFSLPDWEMILAVGDGLLDHDGQGGLEPALAAEMPEVGDDGTSYRFELRPDVRFSDGTTLTPEGLVDSLQRVIALGGEGSDLINSFVSEMEADDEGVSFTLREGFAFFPTLVTGASYVPVHPDTFPADHFEPFPEGTVHGVGPWYIVSHSPNQIVLEPNPYHPDIGEISLGQVVIDYYDSPEELVSALEAGEVDVLWRGMGPEAEAALEDTEEVTVAVVPGGAPHFLTVNHGANPTSDARVRAALALLIDRQAVAEQVYDGWVEPAYSMVPAELEASTDAFASLHNGPDVPAAVDLLTEAGFSAESPAVIELGYPVERYGVEVAAAMEEMERQLEASGLIDVTLTAQAWNTYLGDVVDGTYHLAFLGWGFDFPDPYNFLAPFVLQGGLGGSGLGSEVASMVELLEEAAVEPDESERIEMYEELQVRFAEDVVTLPLWTKPERIAYGERVAADPGLAHPDSLNVGPTLRLDFEDLSLTDS